MIGRTIVPKVVLIVSMSVVGCLTASAKEENWAIIRSDRIEGTGRRGAITDPKLVRELVALVTEAPGDWKQGWATAPAGDIRFAFYSGDHYLDAIGVGKRLMVRGTGGHWESLEISEELEARLRSIFEKMPHPKLPNEPLRDK